MWPRRWLSALPWAKDLSDPDVTKSMTGHLLGAAGALESIATILALAHRVIPGTINLDDAEDIGLDIAAENRPLPEGDRAAMNNSFGFGGHNVALVFRSV